MKKLTSWTLILPALIVTACANDGSKDPVPDIQHIREQAKLQGNQAPQSPQKEIVYVPKEVPVTQEKIVYVPKEVPVVQEKKVYVPKEVPVVQQQTTLNDSYVKIVMTDKVMSFYEGEAGAYKINLRVLDPEIKMKLTAKNLPAGAELKDVSTANTPNAYELRWTPALYTIGFDEQPPKVFAMTLVPTLVSAKTPQKAEVIKGLSLEKTLTFSVFRTQQKPSELVIDSLPAEVQEGESVPFTVTAKFPGMDNNSPVKPNIAVFKDNTSKVAGTDALEMDGARYVSVENMEYAGDFKWKFNLVFDTKNNAVEAQKTKTGAIAPGTFTQVRFGVRVYGAFNASPVSIARVKINRASAPVAASTAAPATETVKAGK